MLGSLGFAFVLLVLCGIPIAFALGMAGTIATIASGSIPLTVIPQRLFTGIDSFALLAIPFFILAGELMSASGIIGMLIRFAQSLVGRISGGLAQVNILASMIFAGVSGSAVADASALGSVLIPSMKEEYGIEFAAGICASAAAIGPIIPPSIPMIIYALVGNVSIAGLFMAGVFPGILIGLGMMVLAYIIARRREYPTRTEAFHLRALLANLREASWALVMPILIVGGILWGVFTPTEAGAAAVAYALFVGFVITRALRIRDLPKIIVRTGVVSAIVLIIVATSNLVSWILTVGQVAAKLSLAFKTISSSPAVFLLVVNILLLIVGCLMDLVPAMIMLTPVLAPMAGSYGVDPLHFGFVVVLNLVIGLLTPPVGTVLYVVTGIAGIPMGRVVKAMIPFLLWQIAVLFGVTYIPGLALWLPRALGY